MRTDYPVQVLHMMLGRDDNDTETSHTVLGVQSLDFQTMSLTHMHSRYVS